MNLFTKISSLLETQRKRPIIKTLIGSMAAIGLSIGAISIVSNSPADVINDNDTIIETTVEPTGNTIVTSDTASSSVTSKVTTVTTKQTTTAKPTTAAKTNKITEKATVAPTTAATTIKESTASVTRNPAPAVVTPTVDDGEVTTVEEVANDTVTTDIVVTTIESTTISETTTTIAEVVENENREYVVYKPSTHYVHRNTCHWYTDECYEITSTEGLECRICTECNPDITVVTPYVEAPAATVVNTSGHAALNYVTEEERIYLCNTVAQEYGSDWVPIYDKAMVVATVMNRVRDGGWTDGLPSTVYNVLTARYQYDPSYATPYYRWNVTQSCIDAVDYYFENMSSFPNVHSFYGDGTYNYFR